jgi:hypothetical protein
MNGPANCPTEAPLNADCRAYNLTARSENGAVQKDPVGREVRGAFFRIHASNSATGETCNAATAKDQIECLTSQAPGSVGLAYGGATPPPRIVASDDFFMGPFANTLGFISNAYGTLQAVDAIINFLFNPKSDLAKATEEIINAIKITEKHQIIGGTNGVAESFKELREQPTNREKQENLLGRANDLWTTIEDIIKGGDTNDIYQYAPAFNTLAIMIAITIKLNGASQKLVNEKIEATLQYNYLMVGADLIDVPDCACTGKCERVKNDASLGKLLWKKFRFPTVSCGTPDKLDHGGLVLLDMLEYCDVNTPAECWFGGNPPNGLGGPAVRPDEFGFNGHQVSSGEVPKCYNQAVSQTVSTFDKDNVVDLIKQAISFANANGFPSVTELHLTGFRF